MSKPFRKESEQISPNSLPSGSRFELECDHDYVQITTIQTNSTQLLWQGGCERYGGVAFRGNKNEALRIELISDESVSRGGFDAVYEVNGPSPEFDFTPCPGPAVCSSHGTCPGTMGRCSCNVGYTGEDCSNHIICCSDPEVCTHPVCSLESGNLIVVSGAGDDIQGTPCPYCRTSFL